MSVALQQMKAVGIASLAFLAVSQVAGQAEQRLGAGRSNANTRTYRPAPPPRDPSVECTERFFEALEALGRGPLRYGQTTALLPERHNCYTIAVEAAVRAGLVNRDVARLRLALADPYEANAFLKALAPDGVASLAAQVNGKRVSLPCRMIPRGELVSLDGSGHVMWSTGRLLPGCRHEVWSFKGFDESTPVWGGDGRDAPDDPRARLRRTTVERELEILGANGEMVADVAVNHGRPFFLAKDAAVECGVL